MAMLVAENRKRKLVARAKALQATSNLSSWELADVYLELHRGGWTQQRIADECEANQDAEWFQRAATLATAICLVNGRIKFLDAHGNPGSPLQGQVVLSFGAAKFVEHFRGFGVCVSLKTF